MSDPTNKFGPEDQSTRWIKYGSNVVLSIVLVVALAVLLTWFAQRATLRADLTANGSLSLKPQTKYVLNQLKQKITLVSLYARPEDKPEQAEQARVVSDLLDEYHRHSSNVDVRIIDPIKEKDKLEELHVDLVSRYGSQIKNYKDYLDDWKAKYDELRKLTDAESKRIAPFAGSEVPGAEDESVVTQIVRTITDQLPDRLSDARTAIDHELKNKHPDFKAATTTAKEQMDYVSRLAAAIIQVAPQVQPGKGISREFVKYLTDAIPRYQAIKSIADDEVAKAGKLGELKIDRLEQALNVENPVLVLGQDDWRILSQRQVWQDDTDLKQINASGKVTPRFAGEQAVTTAVYSLANPKKQKVCFVRGGGQPWTQPGFPPFIPGGPMSAIADRLREYNFDVSEKDLSGNWAMQAQMQRMPSGPEPSDEEIADAIWVCLNLPPDRNEQAMQPTPIGPRLKEHLAHGGSALVLSEMKSDNMVDPLKDWGIEQHTDSVCVHEPVKLTEAAASDMIEEAKSRPYVWTARNYGDHPLATPIRNLEAVFVAPVVIRTTTHADCTVTPLLNLTDNLPGLQTWGDSNIDDVGKGDPTFQPGKGDQAPPVGMGAAVEKKDAGRLVVFGSVQSFTNGFMRILDPKLARRDPPIRVNRFPGNGELIMNSVFWLAHLEPMISISPAAMDVSRISDMSPTTLNMWRIGMVLVLLPGAVLAAGIIVYASRQD